MEPFTKEELTRLASEWYHKLDEHVPVEAILPLLAEEGFEIHVPEGIFRGHDGFKCLYEEGWTRRYFDEVHELKELSFTLAGGKAEVKVVVNWQARTWDPPAPKSKRVDVGAYQTWVVDRSPRSCTPVILTYILDATKPMSGSDGS